VTLHQNAKTCPASRRLLCQRVEEQGWSLRAAAEAAGLSERRAAEWLGRWRAGDRDLEDRSSVARKKNPRAIREVEEAIRALRELRFSGVRIAEALGMPERTVRAVLARHGLSRLAAIDAHEPKNRYERPMPGDLVHIDVKKLAKVPPGGGHRKLGRNTETRRTRGRGGTYTHIHTAIDAYSRVAYSEFAGPENAINCVAFLDRAVAWFADRGIPVEQVMTDNGSCYVSSAHADSCHKLGLRHLRTRPYRPRTNGKAERFIQTLQNEWAYGRAYTSSTERSANLPTWLNHYNYRRPHGSLSHRPPAARLRELTGTT